MKQPIVSHEPILKSSDQHDGKKAIKNLKPEVVQYVLPVRRGWVVKPSNAKKFFVFTLFKAQAISVALELAQARKSVVEIHHKNGKIERKVPALA